MAIENVDENKDGERARVLGINEKYIFNSI